VFFYLPVSWNGLLRLLLGMTIWNGASWFLFVLVFIKIAAYLYINKRYLLFISSLAFYFFLFVWGVMLPFYVQLTFLFLPFYFAGLIGRDLIDKFICFLIEIHWVRLLLAVMSLGGILLFYKFSSVPHTNEVISFCPRFYLYWLTGFFGIIFLLCICLTLDNIRFSFITGISSATLFIMCSHYELLKIVGSYLTSFYNDWCSLAFSILYFVIQCIAIPVVLRYIPILAGRKKTINNFNLH